MTLNADFIQHLLHSSGSVPNSKHAIKQLLQQNYNLQQEKETQNEKVKKLQKEQDALKREIEDLHRQIAVPRPNQGCCVIFWK